MRLLACVLIAALAQGMGSSSERPDLTPMLADEEALQHLLIAYWPPSEKSWRQTLLVRGDGSLILQALPVRPMPVTDIPTCTEHISTDGVKTLVRLILQSIFWNCPKDNSFL